MTRWVLARLVLIALSYLAVSAALATIPGRAINYWYLYYSPVIIAALSFGLVGSLVGAIFAILSLGVFYVRVDAALREAGIALVRQIDASSSGLGQEIEQRIAQVNFQGIIASNGVLLEVRSLRDTFLQALLGVIIITLASCLVGWLVDQNKRRYVGFEEQARVDALTGVPNYRRLVEYLTEQVARGERYGHTFAFMMIDVDGLKAFNDRYGHRIGNDILAEVAHRLSAALRENVDMVARYGGDEFGVVLSETDPGGITTIADRLRSAVAGPLIVVGQVEARVTISVGAAIYPTNGKTVSELIEAADAALYQSKLEGKNAVTLSVGASSEEAPQGRA